MRAKGPAKKEGDSSKTKARKKSDSKKSSVEVEKSDEKRLSKKFLNGSMDKSGGDKLGNTTTDEGYASPFTHRSSKDSIHKSEKQNINESMLSLIN